uniref:Putative movement protein P8 n=1 Tax=Hibiscus chlorotic ringspot virus TaxID=53181 RepID=A0A3Q8U708_9TOMB|nr:putative movement protein P8 [Hibiscus chlorotic ringspot virus]
MASPQTNDSFIELNPHETGHSKGAGKGNRQAKKEVALQAVHKANKQDEAISGGSFVFVADKVEVTININF